MNMSEWITQVECTGVERRTQPNKHHVYILRVHWNNGSQRLISRTYTAFFDFRTSLKDQLSSMNGVTIPELPGLKWFERGILSSMKAGIMEKKKSHIEEFCKQVLQMPVDIVRGPTVQSFFKPWKNDEDSPPNSTFYTPSPHTGRAAVGESVDRTRSLPMSSASSCPPSKPQRSSEGSLLSDLNGTPDASKRDASKPNGVKHKVSDEAPEQLYLATTTYDKRKSGEVNLHRGNLVDVIQKDLSGWWFVHVEDTGEQGWAPGSYLQPKVSQQELDAQQTGSLGRFRTLVDYDAKSTDEVSYKKGDEVEVLAVNMDGWWKILYRGQVGLTPATNLEQIMGEEDSVIRRDKDKGIARSLYHHHSIYKKRSPPPRRTEKAASVVYAQIDPNKKTRKDGPLQKSVSVDLNSSQGSDVDLEAEIPLAENRLSSFKQDRTKQVTRNPTLNYTEIEFDEDDKGKKPVVRKQSAVLYSEVVPTGNATFITIPDQPSKNAKEQTQSYENVSLGRKEKSRFYIALKDHTPNTAHSTGLSVSAGDVLLIDSESGGRVQCIHCNTPADKDQKPREGWVPREILEDFLPEIIEWPAGQKAPIVKDTKSTPILEKLQSLSVEADDSLDLAVSIPAPASSSPAHSPPILKPKPTAVIMEAICSYESQEPSTASFEVGDLAVKVKDSGSGWTCVKLHGRVTWVPSEYWKEKELDSTQQASKASAGPSNNYMNVELQNPFCDPFSPPITPKDKKRESGGSKKRKKSQSSDSRPGPWFVGVMSRVDCEELLLQDAENKGFVIRASTNRVGDYTLSVRYNDRIRHFPITLTQEKRYCIGKYDFRDLNKVVSYYLRNPLFYDGEIAVSLGEPCLQEAAC